MQGGGGAAARALPGASGRRARARLRRAPQACRARRGRVGRGGTRMGQGPARRPAREGSRRIREALRRHGGGAGGAGRVPRRRGARQAARRAARCDPRRARVLEVDAVGGRRAPVRPTGAVALRTPRRGRSAGRRHLVRAPLHLGADRDPIRRELCGDVAGTRRRAGRGRAPSADRRRAAGRLARSAREARRGRPSRREPGRARGWVRRALPRAAGAGDRDGDAGPPALLPARRAPASRSSRTGETPRS